MTDATKNENESPSRTSRDEITARVDALMLKLLDGIERDITAGAGALPGPHVAAYEALCRAEATRLG